MKKCNIISYIFLISMLFVLGTAKAQDCDNSRLIIDQNFNQYNGQNKLYTRSLADNDFPKIAGRTSGGNVRGLTNEFPQENRVINGELRAEYLKNDASGRTGGFVFDSSFDGVEEAALEYRVKFADDFVWATGGKLPGLGGASTPNGAQPAGCTQNQSTIENSFSCRLMWRSNIAHTQPPYLIVYDYLPNRETTCGGNMRLGNLQLQRNTWYTVKQYLKLNTPGQKNGLLKMYINGEKLVDLDDVMFRLSGKGSVKINSIVMHTYRGGNRTDEWWQSPQDDYTYFDDFKVWTNCTGNTDDGVNSPPTVTITTPNSNNYDEGEDIPVNINTNDPDGNIIKHEIFINGSIVDTDGSDYTTYVIQNAQPGTYEVKVTVTDNDNATTSTTKNFIVSSQTDNQLPNVSFETPSQNITLEEGYEKLEVTVNATDTDGSISTVKLFIDDTFIREEIESPYEWGFRNFSDELLGLPIGEHVIKAEATDNIGGISNITFVLTIEKATLSTDDFNDPTRSITIYPNPVKQNNIYIAGISKTNVALEVADMLGNVVISTNVSGKDKVLKVDQLTSGVYLLTIKTGTYRVTKLFLKN